MRSDQGTLMPVAKRGRNRLRAVVLALCCMAALSGCAHAAAGAAPRNLPLPAIKNDCATCHVMERGKKTGPLKQQLSALCLACHPDRTAPSEHKVDIVPSMKVSGLPLTNGRMTCVTCHDPHANRYGKLLRLKGTDLCVACHRL